MPPKLAEEVNKRFNNESVMSFLISVGLHIQSGDIVIRVSNCFQSFRCTTSHGIVPVWVMRKPEHGDSSVRYRQFAPSPRSEVISFHMRKTTGLTPPFFADKLKEPT